MTVDDCTSRATWRRGRSWAALALGLALVLGAAGSAASHASLVRAEPADGALLPSPPQRFTLTFSEPVSPLVLQLVRPDGATVALGRATLRDRTLDIEAPAAVGSGTHVLTWRVVSEDGHPVGGSVVFSIGAASTAPDARQAIEWPVCLALWSARLVLYAGLFLGIGGAFFQSWIARGSRHGVTIVAGATLLGLAGDLLSIGIQGLDALNLPLTALVRRAAWEAGLGTRYGVTGVVAAVALFAALICCATRRRGATRVLSLAAVIGAGLALAASGHAGAADPQWLTRPAVFVHAVAIAFWAGALIPLGILLAVRAPEATAALRRFSRAIPFALLPLLVAGIVLAVVQIERPGALIATAYGWVLLAKLALVTALLGLAGFNRWRLTGAATAGDAAATHTLVRTIAVEIALVVAILGVSALWRFTPPPRATAAAEPAEVHLHTAKAMAEVTMTPGRAGPVAASILIMTGDLGPLDAKEVTLVLANPAAGIEPIRIPTRKSVDGPWRADLTVPRPGHWSLRIDILISDFELTRLEGTVDIKP
jgi:copper transport protein